MQKWIQTPLGKVWFYVNGNAVDIEPTELSLDTQVFKVDGRYKVMMDTSLSKTESVLVEAVLESNLTYKSAPSTGENLALIEFDYGYDELNIGFRGDICTVRYKYLHDRICIYLPEGINIHEMQCNVAWITHTDENLHYTYTWFAADPTYGNALDNGT